MRLPMTERIKSKKNRFCYDHPRPAVTVDLILFRRSEKRIEVLLIRRAGEPFKHEWALPGGFVDRDESLEAAAARELEEETGYKAAKLVPLGWFYTTPGLTNEKMHAYVGMGLKKVGQDLEEDEAKTPHHTTAHAPNVARSVPGRGLARPPRAPRAARRAPE